MTIEIRTDTPPVADAPPVSTGPIGRVTATSLVAGAVGAVASTMAVFPGAAESTITGSILTAFGLGWAMLAGLSSRFTAQPQSWAKVPAAVLSVTGLVLLVLHPGNSAMTALNWIWPVPMLALTVWMHRQQRTATPRRVRWMLAPVTTVLVLASFGAAYQNVASIGATPAAPGRLYPVDGRNLHLDCHGHGGPTTVLFNGLGGSSALWARISTDIAHIGQVCAFDRAGQGWSDEPDEPQDAKQAASDLHAVLAQAGIAGPFVLVGHSTGGAYALTYAASYPDQVAGMVLLDSSSPDQFDLPAYPSQYAGIRRVYALGPTLWRLGIGHLVAARVPSPLPEPAASQLDTLLASPDYVRNARDEVSVLPTVFPQAQALTTLGSVPLAVLTASDTIAHTNGWTEAQDALVNLSSNHLHRVVQSSHIGMVEDEAPAANGARAIAQVIEAVREHAQMSPR